MRTMVRWLPLSGAVLLAACGGDTGLQTVGSVAPPTGGGTTPTPTHSFVDPTEAKTYEAIGAVQHYEYATRSDGSPITGGPQMGQLYAGDANTARDSGITIAYNPRDAIFEVTIARPLGLVSTGGMRFQDPAHRTDFANVRIPQAGVPNLPAAQKIQYLESGSGTGSQLTGGTYYTTAAARSDYVIGAKGYTSTTQTFFYQKPGTTTKYVTYAGFVRNTISATEQQDDATAPLYLRESYSLDRAAFVFGERTANSAVPRSGSGSYTGEMIATVAFNSQLDFDPSYPTYLQWINGTHTTAVNFGTGAVTSNFTGTVIAPALDAYSSGAFQLPGGSIFTATAGATIDLVNKAGFTGNFSMARFTRPGMADFVLNIAGSSIDGAFFGPNGEEIGGGFRIVGGTPDQRIDILGAFTGKK
ncbi:MAG: transferrin-binding protein-like solute binding protein [Pseudomonadota bacterium]